MDEVMNVAFQAIVGTKGQVVIPVAARRELGIKPGQRVAIKVQSGSVHMRPLPDDLIASLTGRFADGPSLTEALAREHAAELEHDARRSRPKGVAP
jgi:AbrB family looped-hinge helix DNA binding protein